MLQHKVNYDCEKLNDNYQSLRVAQVAPVWFSVPPKDYGGTEALISNLSEELIKQGHNVTLFASGDSQTSGELKHYIEKYLFSKPETSWYNETEAEYHLISSFREIAKNPQNYDIVHIHISSASDLIGLKLASQLKLPHICTLHNRFPFDLRKNHLGEADKYYFTWGKNSPLIAISNSAKENALLDFGSPLNFIGVIHHGLPEHEFLKEEISQRRHLAWVGGINRRKGPKTAIEAAIKAKRKIIIAGVVDKSTPESLAYFEQEVLPLIEQNPDYVQYIGPVNSKQRFELLKNAYCFLNPIDWEEPFGLVMIEAMACGCPVISFRRGAAKELIKPGKNGVFAASSDEMSAMIESVGNINRKQMITDTWNEYSITTMTERYVMKYREVSQCFSANSL